MVFVQGFFCNFKIDQGQYNTFIYFLIGKMTKILLKTKSISIVRLFIFSLVKSHTYP
jgi:hypothetical protein